MSAPRLVCTVEQIREFFVRIFPQSTVAIDEMRPGGARATLLKVGKRLAFADVRVHSEGELEAVAQAMVTYAIPIDAEAVAAAYARNAQKNV